MMITGAETLAAIATRVARGDWNDPWVRLSERQAVTSSRIHSRTARAAWTDSCTCKGFQEQKVVTGCLHDKMDDTPKSPMKLRHMQWTAAYNRTKWLQMVHLGGKMTAYAQKGEPLVCAE